MIVYIYTLKILWHVCCELPKGQNKETILAYKGCGHNQNNSIVWQYKFVINCVPYDMTKVKQETCLAHDKFDHDNVI